MSHVIGIDLGTTNSCVAVMEGRDVVVIPNAEGGRITPSMVAITEADEKLVGHVAKRQSITNPDCTVYGAKRLIGRKYGADEVQRLARHWAFTVIEAENGDAWVEVRGKRYSPSEVSALVLKRLKKAAEEYLGEEVGEAVITVPAYFDEAQRRATRDAGRIAGLNVKRIINEPTAAALAYGLDSDRSQRVAVYDLGGGTFDISILELTSGVFEVKATSGDTFLGGEDFDLALIEDLATRFQTETGLDVRSDKYALQRIKEAAEKAKHELSISTEAQINLPFIMADDDGPKHLNTVVTRDEFEALTGELVRRSLVPCQQALEDSGLAAEDIDEVILVGGMTRMPMVVRVVEEFFGRQAHRGVHPDEVVAVGAAIQAAVLQGELKEVLLLDVTPLSLGIETQGGMMTPVMDRNTTIPTRKSQVFTTTVDNQPLVSVHVLQGERAASRDNKSLARFDLVGLLPAPRGVPQIEVSFDIDANGILHVSARDLATGKSQSVEVHASGGLSEDEINNIIHEAAASEDDDRKRRAFADLQIKADTLIYTTQKAIGEYSDRLEEELLERANGLIDECRRASSTSEPAELEAAIAELESAAMRVTEAIWDIEGSGEAAAE